MSFSLTMDSEYKQWLTDIKAKIQQSQIKAAISVNVELLKLYWQVGTMIVEKQSKTAWGNKLIEQLSHDLLIEFPEMKGFSRTNLLYIRKWYLFYRNDAEIVPQVVGQLEPTFAYKEIFQIPWGHNREIISKCKTREEAIYYVQNTIRYNWSRAVLVHQIESKLYHREGKAINNFELTLPKPQSDLAKQTLKDPYVFDFLHLTKEYGERDLENGLVAHITKFLLELGAGFSFLGRQYHLEIGGQDFYLDLLFYHVKLHCYIVIDLKATQFQPEHAGKLNFYLSAVDDLLRGEPDQPTIGILICKDKTGQLLSMLYVIFTNRLAFRNIN